LGFSGKISDFQLGSDELFSRHAFFKTIGESIVASKASKYLIIRPSLMIGEDARINTLVSIVKGNKGPFTLSKDSEFNLITHDQIFFCLQAALSQKMMGIINLCSGLYLTLDKVANHVGNNNVNWGNYKYQTPKIKESNAIKLFKGMEYDLEGLISKIYSW
jgi:hypothetical protein